MSLYDLFNNINKGDYLPLPEYYSDELKLLIYSMLKVNPTERIDIDGAVKTCELAIEAMKKPRIDPFMIMDDINEKLKLLDYEKLYCSK
jgi:hypothetical protein